MNGEIMNEATVTIAADPEQVWALVTDIRRMGEWSPENIGGRWLGRAKGPALGARFIGFNAHGLIRWPTRCRVIECEPPDRFAFRVAESGMAWGWRLEPENGGTRLTQWRERVVPLNPIVKAFLATGVLGRDREALLVDGMHQTLGALKAHAERRR
jgi:uncharacterized protein YndB with AHSA1/START domain